MIRNSQNLKIEIDPNIAILLILGFCPKIRRPVRGVLRVRQPYVRKDTTKYIIDSYEKLTFDAEFVEK